MGIVVDLSINSQAIAVVKHVLLEVTRTIIALIHPLISFQTPEHVLLCLCINLSQQLAVFI